MILILFAAIIFSMSHLGGLPQKLSDYSQVLHHFCLRTLPSGLENLESLEALVCGKNMQDLQLKELLLQSSLIHIFVVSGSHFLFLRNILARLPVMKRFPLLILSVYALVTLCQPPSIRALLFIGLAEISERRKWFLSPVLLVFVSSLLSVALFPQWLFSRSLLMSMMAALVIAVMADIWAENSKSLPAVFISQSVMFCVMGFCLWGFSYLHPISILLNVLLGPLIGVVLFPLGFFVVLCPPLGFVFDQVMNALIWVLKKNSALFGESPSGPIIGLLWQWALFFALLVGSYHWLVSRKRKKAEYV